MATPLDSPQTCERIVREFLDSWHGTSLDAIVKHFSEDAVYHNVPVAPIKGKAGIRQIFQGFLDAFEQSSLDIVTLATAPGLVIAERVDRFLMRNGRKIALPVTGVFEIRNGLIVRFSDYFDLGDFERQSGIKL